MCLFSLNVFFRAIRFINTFEKHLGYPIVANQDIIRFRNQNQIMIRISRYNILYWKYWFPKMVFLHSRGNNGFGTNDRYWTIIALTWWWWSQLKRKLERIDLSFESNQIFLPFQTESSRILSVLIQHPTYQEHIRGSRYFYCYFYQFDTLLCLLFEGIIC